MVGPEGYIFITFTSFSTFLKMRFPPCIPSLWNPLRVFQYRSNFHLLSLVSYQLQATLSQHIPGIITIFFILNQSFPIVITHLHGQVHSGQIVQSQLSIAKNILQSLLPVQIVMNYTQKLQYILQPNSQLRVSTLFKGKYYLISYSKRQPL